MMNSDHLAPATTAHYHRLTQAIGELLGLDSRTQGDEGLCIELDGQPFDLTDDPLRPGHLLLSCPTGLDCGEPSVAAAVARMSTRQPTHAPYLHRDEDSSQLMLGWHIPWRAIAAADADDHAQAACDLLDLMATLSQALDTWTARMLALPRASVASAGHSMA